MIILLKKIFEIFLVPNYVRKVSDIANLAKIGQIVKLAFNMKRSLGRSKRKSSDLKF